jgi:glycosidase
MYHRRKEIERDVLSSHGDATRYFVTFLDNHDVKERLRYVAPDDAGRFDDQVTLGLTCLLTLPGIPCIYYGTEQGLHGHGTDEAVREALWGGPGFDRAHPFFAEIAKLSQLREALPSLRYGRFYFRPISGDAHTFGISPYPQGVLAYSRILNDEETLVIANTNAAQPATIYAIVDASLNAAGSTLRVVYRNKPGEAPAAAVGEFDGVLVYEVDGTFGTGPVRAVSVTLQPLEVQVLTR